MPLSTASLSILQLSAIKGLGLKTFHYLFRELGSVRNILNTEHSRFIELGIKPAISRAICDLADSNSRADSPDILRTREWADCDRHYLLGIEDADYPARLREIYCPPPVLYVKGRLSAFALPAIAMVGSRNSSIAGTQHAFTFARDFALAGCCVYSGLALGVDAASHQGALYAQGMTCAVLATGLDKIYPRQHTKLADEIVETGVLVSEMNLGSKPVPANFPRRNRIISGLAQGVVVVEASLKSGSLITANYALEQNRDVFAIPGSIDSPVSRGCHSLIKQGARLVETAEDVLEEWVNDVTSPLECEIKNKPTERAGSFAHLSNDERLIMSHIDFQCVSFDLLLHHTELDVGQLTHLLIGLELKDELCSVPGGYQRLKAVHSPA